MYWAYVSGLDMQVALKMTSPGDERYSYCLPTFDYEEEIYMKIEQFRKRSEPPHRQIAPRFLGRYTFDGMEFLVMEKLEPAKFEDWSELDEHKKYVNYHFGLCARIN